MMVEVEVNVELFEDIEEVVIGVEVEEDNVVIE